MILDIIENAHLYFGLGEGLQKGLEFLKTTNFSTIATGKYFVDGENLVAMVNEYETKPAGECKLESHLKYIDIQLMLSGCEQVGYLPKNDQIAFEAYNAEKDVMFFQETSECFTFSKGQFAIFFPTDLHQPCIISGEACSVRKVVMKVAV